MKPSKKRLKQELASDLRKAYNRMRLLPGVHTADLNAMIDTWELLEKETRKDDARLRAKAEKKAARRVVYVGGYAGHAEYRARGGLDLP